VVGVVFLFGQPVSNNGRFEVRGRLTVSFKCKMQNVKCKRRGRLNVERRKEKEGKNYKAGK
jgi:hypothetical protein